jgi:hypothetical protein
MTLFRWTIHQVRHSKGLTLRFQIQPYETLAIAEGTERTSSTENRRTDEAAIDRAKDATSRFVFVWS